MRNRPYVLTVAVVVSLLCLIGAIAQGQEVSKRETVLDNVEHVEPELMLEVPAVPRLCDELKLQGRHIDIGGCKLYCEVDGTGIPIVLLHGGPGATHHYFHPSFSRAAEWAQVVYYDQRGCGLSDYERGDGYSIDQAVRDLDALRQALGIEKWVVLGHSYGGALGQCYTVKYPERVLGLVLVGSVFDGHRITTGNSRQYQFITKAETKRMDSIREDKSLNSDVSLFNVHLNGDWKRQNFYRPGRDQLARMALYEWKHDSRFRTEMGQSLQSVYLDKLFEGCPVPILILEGKWDLTWGADKAEKLHGCFPGSDLVVFEMAGHSPFQDAPHEFFPALKAFVSSLSEPPDDAVAQWKGSVAGKIKAEETSPERVIRKAGFGRASSEQLASQYSVDWLDRIKDTGILLRLGFALYDAKRYEDARCAFERMAEVADDNMKPRAVAQIWQGHMLDLLGKRKEAQEIYQRAAEVEVNTEIRHDQYRIAYKPASYAKQRTKKPFSRIENTWKD